MSQNSILNISNGITQLPTQISFLNYDRIRTIPARPYYCYGFRSVLLSELYINAPCVSTNNWNITCDNKILLQLHKCFSGMGVIWFFLFVRKAQLNSSTIILKQMYIRLTQRLIIYILNLFDFSSIKIFIQDCLQALYISYAPLSLDHIYPPVCQLTCQTYFKLKRTALHLFIFVFICKSGIINIIIMQNTSL